MLRGKELALSLAVVGAAGVAGYVLRSGKRRGTPARARASVGARIVEDVPAGATVVDVSSRRLREIPGAQRAIDRAVRTDARDEWVQVVLADDGAWDVVDSLRRSLPYHDTGGASYNGVFVQYGDRIVVLDAIGWAHVEGVPH